MCTEVDQAKQAEGHKIRQGYAEREAREAIFVAISVAICEVLSSRRIHLVLRVWPGADAKGV